MCVKLMLVVVLRGLYGHKLLVFQHINVHELGFMPGNSDPDLKETN